MFTGTTVTSDCRPVNRFPGEILTKPASWVVGHRGWPARYPDNTLSGLIAASDVSDAIEVDVRRSGDGKLILSHDPDLNGIVVSETPWAQLMELDLGDGHHPILLDEAIAALPETPIQYEIKNWPAQPGFEPDHRLALETAERARPGDIVTSFNPDTLAKVRESFADVPTGLAVMAPIALDQIVNFCLDAGHRALVPAEELLTEDIGAELEIYPWTVNSQKRAKELVEFGVTGIITDDPGSISQIRSQH